MERHTKEPEFLLDEGWGRQSITSHSPFSPEGNLKQMAPAVPTPGEASSYLKASDTCQRPWSFLTSCSYPQLPAHHS